MSYFVMDSNSQAINMFGLVAPGRDVMTNFVPIDESRAILMLELPGSVAELSFFLLPGSALPPEHGALLYYSTPPFTDWQIIGGVAPGKSSGIFRTGWPTMESVEKLLRQPIE